MGFNEVLHKADQTLRRELPPLPADFAFRWAGIDFAAQLESLDDATDEGEEDGEEVYRLTLQSALGHMPFSAEDGAARQAVREVLSTPSGELGVRFDVTRQGTVVMTAMTDFPAPLNADSLMQAVTLSLLHLRPALMRLRSLLLRGKEASKLNGYQRAGVS